MSEAIKNENEKREEKQGKNPIFLILMFFLLFNVHALVFCFFLLHFIKKKNRIILAALIGSFVLIFSICPAYLQGVFIAFRTAMAVFLKTFDFWKAYLSLLSGYSILNHICVAHLCFLLVFAIKELKDDGPQIKTFDDDLKGLAEEIDDDEKGGFFSLMRKKVPLGEADFLNETVIGYRNGRPVTIPDDARHVFYAGTTGAGKTVALANAVDSAIKKNYGLLIVDGKGDIGAGSILDIVNILRGDRKLYVFNMKRPEASDKYNPFLGASATAMRDMLINLTTWSEEHYKANTELYLQTVIDLILKCGIEPSFESLIYHMSSMKAKELNDRCLKEKIISKDDYIYNHETITNAEKIASSASARFLTIARSDIGRIFDKDGIDIFEALRQRAIVLFILDPMKYPEMATSFGKLVMVDAIKAVSKLDENPLGKIFYVFDEISTYVSQAIIELVGKSRSYGVTCHLATQAFNDLITKDGFDYRERIIENCNSYVIMRQNSDINAEKWAKIIGTTVGTSSTYQLSGNTYTGAGTATFDREFIFHPDDIKYLPLGTAIFICKDIIAGSRNHSQMVKAKIKIRKCF